MNRKYQKETSIIIQRCHTDFELESCVEHIFNVIELITNLIIVIKDQILMMTDPVKDICKQRMRI